MDQLRADFDWFGRVINEGEVDEQCVTCDADVAEYDEIGMPWCVKHRGWGKPWREQKQMDDAEKEAREKDDQVARDGIGTVADRTDEQQTLLDGFEEWHKARGKTKKEIADEIEEARRL